MSLPELEATTPGTCRCCQLPTLLRMREVTDSPTCPECKAHRSDEKLRDTTHLRLWSARAKEFDARGRKRAEALSTELQAQKEENRNLRAAIAADYMGERSPSLVQLLDSVVVSAADAERDLAYQREAELLSIFAIDVEPLHRGRRGENSRCSCGKLTADCPEWQALEPIRPQVRHFEGKQLERARADKPHNLPKRHPGLPRDKEFKGLAPYLAARFSDLSRDERERLQQV